MGSFHFKLLIFALIFTLISFLSAIFFWGTVVVTQTQNATLRHELQKVSEQAARVTLIEKNMLEIDRYVRYIRFAMSLTGDTLPPALSDFMANDSLKATYETSADSLDFQNIPNIVPCDGWVSREFIAQEKHFGIDYAASVGTIIRTPADGTVKVVRFDQYLCNLVAIDHGNGFVTRYAH